MPYVECERCGLTAFSAAYRFNVEYCARCGARLPRRRSAIDSSPKHPPFRRKERDTPPPGAARR
jgi:ribosomal protein L37E